VKSNSRPVSSKQTEIHRNLASLVRRHLTHPYRKPPTEASVAAFTVLQDALKNHGGPIILDSFCGTGQSTKMLAQRHRDHFVIGVDKSAHRLNRHSTNNSLTPVSANYLLLQAHCEDIWQLMLLNKLNPQRHYLLYPNPWPKSGHLQRRLHGNGSFAWLMQLGGRIELRSNWKLYLEEFDLAVQIAGRPGQLSALREQPPLTLFEQKYRDSGHLLWAYLIED